MPYIDIKEFLDDAPSLNPMLVEYAKKNNIDIDKIQASGLISNMTMKKTNPLVSQYGIFDRTEVEDVYVREIVGQDPNKEFNNLFDLLNNLYSDDKNCGTYHIRSNEFLELGKDEMIEKIRESLSYEEFRLTKYDENKYTVSINGCHRNAILRLLYLDEVLKGDKSIEEIDEKYKFSCIVEKYDFTLTYMKYVLISLNLVKNIDHEYDEYFRRKDNLRIVTAKGSKTASRDEIINYFNKAVNNFLINDESIINQFKHYCDTIPSFKKFILDYVPSLEYIAKENEYGSFSQS